MGMRVANRMMGASGGRPVRAARGEKLANGARKSSSTALRMGAWLLAAGMIGLGAAAAAQTALTGAVKRAAQQPAAPPLAAQAQQFLAERGWTPGRRLVWPRLVWPRQEAGRAGLRPDAVHAQGTTAATATWQALGPTAVQTQDFGLVTGRISALALDPSDTTGNHLYVGATGGGVWVTQNADASTPSSIVFTPLTDSVAALSGAVDASISIGALTVQPGGTGVILAGTGDPNDVLDSYYGTGILRSTDGGTTWTLIQTTQDLEDGLSSRDYSFVGEGFAGFAWSTVNPQLVVAAVSQAYEGTMVDAERANVSYEGLYYSSDSGATWHLACITDGTACSPGSGTDVQGPLDAFAQPDGNAATAVVWNPVRQLFVAAVRFHGYYQSADGITWTRMAAQPGAGLTTAMCPTNLGFTGSIACPIFRGALAVNPETGDTFAWTVDLNNQDQGLWQDQCAISNGACSNPTITFANQWSTAALEENTPSGAATIPNGNYTLALAAVPSGQETMVLAGDDDLWQTMCPVSQGCVWRNTTNATTCMSAQVGEFQHALAWNAANPLEIFVGNDSGLWRSTDAIDESSLSSPEPVCSPTDASHFQNLNGGLGSLSEVVSLSPVTQTPYTLMTGLGVNGTAGVKSTTATADWPQILSGYGGPVAIDPTNNNNWYVNDQPGVAIYLCSQTSACTPADFGTSPVVTDADVGGDGDTMPVPAPFLVDPLDPTQLLIGTCRVWRGPADGNGWISSNAISPILDSGSTSASCSGDALIRSIAAMPLANGSEVVYVGMYGSTDYGANLPGHVLSAIINPSSAASPTWNDLTLNPVTNDTNPLNVYGFDISSIYIDPHDATGNTVYVTVEGMESPTQEVQVVYRSTNGGATWTDITANLPTAPANSVVVDPQNANTVYVATDLGVYFTTQAANCAQSLSNCWSAFGTGLPEAPAVSLSATPAGASAQVLVAGTYGRGLWQTPLWSAGTGLTSAAANPASLTFPSQPLGSASSPLTVTLENTGGIALTPTSIAMSGDFTETDDCANASVPAGGSCTIQVTFTPSATGSRTGQMNIFANIAGGQLTVDLSGTGTTAGVVSLAPATVDFGQVEVGSTSTPLQVTVTNSNGTAIPITGITITSPFSISSNACGSSSLAANTSCQIEVAFTPTQAGQTTGLLSLTDTTGTQTVTLTGTGEAAPTDALNTNSLTFPNTVAGQISPVSPQTQVTITNTGGLDLTFPQNNAITVSGPFQATSNFVTQIAAGSTGTISVQFAPTQVGAVTGTLTITDSIRTQTVALSGTGVAPPAFSVTPTSLTFTNQQPGVASAPQVLTVSNNGGAPMANVGFMITGPAAGSYSLGATTCAAVLNNGSSCTVQVIFTPSGTGVIAATLAISSSTLGVTALSVPLNGSGQLATGLGTNPSQLTFPVVGAGQSSTAQPVTVTNTSNYAVGSVALAATAPFSITQNTCTSSLAAGANCTASVVFQPSAGGAASGTLTVSSTAVATPATVALTGTGFDFSVALSGSGSQTVTAGQQADYTLVITPNGSQGAFSFQCGTLPANALCLFSPSTETLASGVEGNVQVEIDTGQSSSSARADRPAGRDALPLACTFLLLPLALWKRRKALLLATLAAILAAGISSCTSSGGVLNSGSSGQGSGSNTAPGTYTIPVTVSSTGVSHSVSLTLTVD